MTATRPLGTRLIGRDAVVERLTEQMWAREHRLVTVVGPPGVGKTRVADEVASRLRRLPDLANAVHIVDLAAVDDSSRVLATMATACGLVPGEAILDELVALAQERDTVVVLDNMEHVVAAADDVAHLVAGAPRLSVLVTSRVPLGVKGEHRFDLEPLDRDAAVTLFVDRSATAGYSGELDLAVVASICDELDGLPLAIELAAARTRMLSVEQIVHRLDRRLELLAGGPSRAPARQRSMRATIAWSYELLGMSAQRLLRALALLPGTFSPDTAETLGGDGALDGLGILVDHHFVMRVGDRLRIPELVRQFAGTEGTDDERRTTMLDLTAHLTTLAKDVDARLDVAGSEGVADRLLVELDIVRAALAWSIDHRPDVGLELVNALGRFWIDHGPLHEGARWFERAAAHPSTPPAARARALCDAGSMLEQIDEYDRATVHLRRSIDLFTEAGDWSGVADARRNLGSVALDRGDLDVGVELFNVVIAAAREHGDERRVAGATFMLANAAYYQRRLSEARTLWEQALRYFRRRGDDVRTAIVLSNLGALASEEGEHERGLRLTEESLAFVRRANDRVSMACTLVNLAEAALYTGEIGRAEEALAECISVCADLDLPRVRSEALNQLVLVALRNGRSDDALAAAVQALEAGESTGSPYPHLLGMERAASALLEAGEPQRAARVLGVRDRLRDTVEPDPSDDNDRPSVQQLVAELRLRLGSETFERCHAAGRAEPPSAAAETVRLVLRAHTATSVTPEARPAVTRDLPFGLTQREAEVLGFLAQRYTDREIATALFISPRTVTTHVARILTKLGVGGRRQAAAEAIRLGMLAS